MRFGGSSIGSYGGYKTGIDPANVSFTGGNISGVTGVVDVLYAGGVPFISLSSGSVAANGAISAITALPAIYPDAYCYFPANALATVKAAGYYYCTFSSTTAGVAFLDAAPATGVPTIPASPTAVTDGKGAFVGDTGEEFGPTITVPILGVASSIQVYVYNTATNNANVKTIRVRLSGNGGTTFISQSAGSAAATSFGASITNTGSASKQISQWMASIVGSPTVGVLGTVNTGVSTSLVLSLQKATATDNLVLLPPRVELTL